MTARHGAGEDQYATTLPWHIAGSYLEACNCEVICPCRRIGGKQGGRSTYGECLGALSWVVQEGGAGDADLAGMRVVLATRYHDDEPGSPWSYALFVDARGDEGQRQAMADIFTGRLGGTPSQQFPWVFKTANLLAVEALDIEIDHTPGGGWFRAGGKVEVRVGQPVPDQEPVPASSPATTARGASSSARRSTSPPARSSSPSRDAAPTRRRLSIHPRMNEARPRQLMILLSRGSWFA